MNECGIAKSIAILCSEPEQESANELYEKVLDGEAVFIQGDTWELEEITTRIYEKYHLEMCDAFEASVTDNEHAVSELYVTVIKDLME